MDPKTSSYMRISDVMTGALIMGTWATYALSNQIDSKETKTLIHKVLLPLLGLSVLSSSGVLYAPLRHSFIFSQRCISNFFGFFQLASSPAPPGPSAPPPLTSSSLSSSTSSSSTSETRAVVSDKGTRQKNESKTTPTIHVPRLVRKSSSITTLVNKNDDRDTEILVHNVSHSDVILALSTLTPKMKTKEANEGDEEEFNEKPILARPHFSSFNSVVKKLLGWISEHNVKSATAETLERNSQDPKHAFVREGDSNRLNVGLHLIPPCPLNEISHHSRIQNNLSFRKDDQIRLKSLLKQTRLLQHGISGGDSSGESSDNESDGENMVNKKQTIKNKSTNMKNDGGVGYEDSNHDSNTKSSLSKEDKYMLEQMGVTNVYFPLVATMFPVWIQKIKDKHRSSSWSASSIHHDINEEGVKKEDEEEMSVIDRTPSIRKIIFLVSGEGVPRSEGADSEQNSTESSAYMIEEWIKLHYPYVEVIKLHSKSNLFRYDENIAFVKKRLLPKLETIRDYKAIQLGEKWPDAFKITVSIASGSPARITAIQASLRNYKPEFLHIWQRKTFWEKSMICLDDIEFLSSNDVDTLAAERVSSLDGNLELCVKQLIKLKNKYKATLLSQNHDMHSFWHRKSKKVVLSVLLVEKDEIDPKTGQKLIKLYDGTNMEVSMPTGSLCAERNAIGSALSDDLSLKRTELKIIAVLGFNLKNTSNRPPSSTKSSGSSSSSQALNQSSWLSSPPPLKLESPKNAIMMPPTSSQKNVNITPRSRHDSSAEQESEQQQQPPPPPSSQTSSFISQTTMSNHSTSMNPSPNTLNAKCQSDDLNPPISTITSTSIDPLSPNPFEVNTEMEKANGKEVKDLLTTQTHLSSPSRTHIVRDFIHPEDEEELDDDEHEVIRDSSEVIGEEGQGYLSQGAGGKGKRSGSVDSRTSSSSFQGISSGGLNEFESLNDFTNQESASIITPRSNSIGSSGSSGGGVKSYLRRITSTPASPSRSSSQGAVTPAQTAFHIKVCEDDMNPLKPCGSCSEWLKKIAEVNPSFKVLSFTDEDCSGGVYVESIFDS